jgi:hypothetical protein
MWVSMWVSITDSPGATLCPDHALEYITGDPYQTAW